MKRARIAVVVLGVFLSVARADTAGWRTDGSGTYPDATPPTRWSDSMNVVWKTATPDWSNASPAVLGDRLFVLSEKTTLVCLDRDMGAIRWTASNDYEQVMDDRAIAQRKAELAALKPELERDLAELEQRIETFQVNSRRARRQMFHMRRQAERLREQINGEGISDLPPAQPDNGYASATPITDGEHVWAVFGTGVVVCYDADGRRKWARLVNKPRHRWGHSASPRMIDGKLIVPIIDLFALDPLTGRTLWRTPCEAHFGTPAVTTIGDTPIVITTSGQVVRAADGKVLADGLAKMQWNGPLVDGDRVYFIEDSATAYQLPADASEPFEPKHLWSARVRGNRHYASPVVHDGLIYTISREEHLSVLDADTGELVYEREMNLGGDDHGNSAFPSVTLAGDLMFVGALSGEFAVFEPGRTYHEVARNQLERLRSTPVFIGDRMYVRGLEHVYCIAEPAATAAR